MPQALNPIVLLGGIGGDSHSVGLSILKNALLENNIEVLYLGIQNSTEDFFKYHKLANAVLISNMDGHAAIYLKDFFDLALKYQKDPDVEWYLGGNISVDKSVLTEKKFLEMGFTKVFSTFVDIEQVLRILKRSLNQHIKLPHSKKYFDKHGPAYLKISSDFGVSDFSFNTEQFSKQRKQVIDHWRTGRDAENLEANAIFLNSSPSFPDLMNKAEEANELLIQPRSGVAFKHQQIGYFRAFKKFGAGVLSYQVDSLTRNNSYFKVDEVLRDSIGSHEGILNGFPVVNHGVQSLREIVKAVNVPLQTRHSTRDPRLLAEISYAGGVTAYEGGAICYNLPYYKNYSLVESIKSWQYVDYLTGLYKTEFGITLDREYFGTLTATLIPPCIAISTNILEALQSAALGVKCVTLGYAEQGNRHQDIAAIRMSREMANKYLNTFGYNDVKVHTAFYQYMAAFPQIVERAEELIYQSAISAKLAGATKILTKTVVEALKVPSMADNIESLNIVKRGAKNSDPSLIDETKVSFEASLLRREIESIVDSVLELGGGNISKGIVKGFSHGLLDIPFAPSVFNAGKVVCIRDIEGAVRIAKFGDINIPQEIKDTHISFVKERLRKEGNKVKLFNIVEKDVLSVARSQYDCWPLSDETNLSFGSSHESNSLIK